MPRENEDSKLDLKLFHDSSSIPNAILFGNLSIALFILYLYCGSDFINSVLAEAVDLILLILSLSFLSSVFPEKNPYAAIPAVARLPTTKEIPIVSGAAPALAASITEPATAVVPTVVALIEFAAAWL